MPENEKLNQQLYEKMSADQDKYRDWLTSQPPEEILNHAYEYTVREDILMAVEDMSLPADKVQALLSSNAPLDEIYKDFSQIEGDHMDTIRGCIETRANDILENMPRDEVALQTAIGFVEAHKVDEGIDYTLYDIKYTSVDGGVIEDTSLSALEAAMQVCEENSLANPREIPHDELMSKVHEVEDRNVELINEFLTKPPVYKETAEYAINNGEIDLYRRSMRANVECRMAIEDAIADGYDGLRLDTSSVKDIIKQFGAERVEYVLANTIQQQDWDGRYSPDNKCWAKSVVILQDKDPWGGDRNIDFVVQGAHPGLVDLFTSQARKEVAEIEKKPSVKDRLNAVKAEAKMKAPTKSKGQER